MGEFWRWTIRHFTTREHFVRCIATVIIAVAMWQAIVLGKIEDTMLVLVGNVMGFFFKGQTRDENHDPQNPAAHDTATIRKP